MEVCTKHSLIEVCTSIVQVCTSIVQVCTAHFGMSDLFGDVSINPFLFLMMHRNDPEIESKAKLMTRACCCTYE